MAKGPGGQKGVASSFVDRGSHVARTLEPREEKKALCSEDVRSWQGAVKRRHFDWRVHVGQLSKREGTAQM